MIAEPLAELTVPIGSVRPYGRNPRRGDVAAIRRSLEVNGQYRPIVVNRRTGEVLAGNHTWQAAVDLGWGEVAATFVDVGEEDAARIVLADNRTAELGGYDDAELALLLASLPGLDGTAWHDRELERLLARIEKEGTDAARDTEPGPRPARPKTNPGTLYQLGAHRLLCGDSTREAEVERVLAGDAIEMVWTDPPYGVNYHDAKGRGLANDHTDQQRLYDLLLLPSLTLAREQTLPGGAVYVAHGDVAYTVGGSVFRKALLDAGWDLKQVLVWVKSAFVLSRQDYHWQHEPILYGWKPGAAHRFRAERNESTVIDDDVDLAQLDRRQLVALVRELQNERGTTVTREDRPRRSDLHPTSRLGDVVYEPFGGSGTTLIACENLGRRGRAVELDPGYCDVIVDRWERHTGEKATQL